ncbi:MAG: LysM peptidoglycan-binding domain-containing protein [Spirochaetaceae bacterium]|nr:LysM peptidoglycan-binding domain-containing protein [Spirochaetaceae bacterium]
MNRGILFLLMGTFVLGAPAVFSQPELPEPVLPAPEAELSLVPPSGYPFFDGAQYFMTRDPGPGPEISDFSAIPLPAATGSSDASPAVPGTLRNNRYFLESARLTKLAQESYENGDYDASSQYAAEALKYALLSDEYVALQLKIKETNDAIAAARKRLDWAASVGAAGRYPSEYGQAQTAYNEALSLRTAERWDDSIAAAYRVINALANVTEETVAPPPPVIEGPALPAQYTVRPWAVSRDCLWNIAGRPWAYGDPAKWRVLYNANRTKLPDPDNPNLIHPGMVLDIPSVQGERRRGMWDAGHTYSPLR